VFLVVGLLEVVSISFRPVSLSMRLFCNIFAGENIIETITYIGGPWLGWFLAVPIYVMELLVGFLQALVFMLLTSVYLLLILPHEEHKH